MRNIILTIAILLAHLVVRAQTDLLFSSHGLSVHNFNPAIVDDDGHIHLGLGTRQQWIGFPDAPEAQFFALEHFIEDYQMGLKLTAFNQGFGKESFRRFSVAYSYRVRLGDASTLSFGLGAGFYQRVIRFSQLVFLENNEPLVRPDEQYVRPDFEFGLHLRHRDLNFGYAANHLSTPARDASLSRVAIHHHGYAAYFFRPSGHMGLHSMLSFHRQGKVSFLQASALAEIGMLQAGLGWRHTDALILIAGLRISDKARISYTYDFAAGTTARLSSGTHEVSLRLSFDKKSGAYLSPRFMDFGN
ncbi:MAG: PorP/SprF family type IX secretion system membrane protein [Bacteroidetes bacterium]|nr:PorP/SprF family type IX secretion system membrane protein [Bacteroidota bacterium]